MKHWKNKGSIQPQCEILVLRVKVELGKEGKERNENSRMQKYEFCMKKYFILIHNEKFGRKEDVESETEIFLVIGSRKNTLGKMK